MKNLKVYAKNFADQEWSDVTKATLSSRMTLRQGFGSLGDGSDVGKLSITFKADDLAAAAVFHTTAKQIRLVRDGFLLFEGYTEGAAKVKSTASSSLAWIQLSVFPYSALAEEGKFPESVVYQGYKILDPADKAHSLIHKLVDLVWSSVPDRYKAILPTLPAEKIITNISIPKTLPLVVIDADDKPLEVLDGVLKEYGLARYMEGLQMVILEPYADNDGRSPYAVDYNSILAKPTIKSAPYVVTKKCVVNLGKIVEKGPEIVYMLDDDDGAEEWAEEFVPAGGVWPEGSDIMEASYGTPSENEDLELFYAQGLSYELKTSPGADIRAEKADLKGAEAEFKFKNYGADHAYIWQLKVNAQKTFYRDYSYTTQDEELSSEEADDIDSVYMVDAEDAAHYIKTYRAEKKAESQRITISSGKVSFHPGELITLGNIPYTILVRYVENNLMTGVCKAECVVYDVREIATTGKVQSGSAIGNGVSYITIALSGSVYRYKSDGSLSDVSKNIIKATVKRYGTMESPRWYINGEEVIGEHGITLEVPPKYMDNRSFIVVEVTVGRYRASGYIYRINDGTTPIVQYRYSDSNTEPPLLAGGVWMFRGKPFFLNGGIFGEMDAWNWSTDPAPQEGKPFKWMRTSTDEGKTWVYSCITGKDGKVGADGKDAINFDIMAEQTTYPLSSRGVMLEATDLRVYINRQNLTQEEVCTWTVTPASLQPEVNVGDSLIIHMPKGFNESSVKVQASIMSVGIRSVVLSGVRAGSPEAEYFGDGFDSVEALQAMKQTPTGEPLMNGDNAVVVLRRTGADGKVKTDPVPYVYDAGSGTWVPLQGTESNYSQVMSNVLGDVLKQPDTQVTSKALYGFFKNLAALNAFIENLIAMNVSVEDPNNKNGMRVQIATVGDNAKPVFKVMYGNNTVFQVDPASGRIFFGQPNGDLTAPVSGFMYTPANGGSILSKNSKVTIRSDGSLAASNASFNGTAVITHGHFEGTFDCESIYTEARRATVIQKQSSSESGRQVYDFIASVFPEIMVNDEKDHFSQLIRCNLVRGNSDIAYMQALYFGYENSYVRQTRCRLVFYDTKHIEVPPNRYGIAVVNDGLDSYDTSSGGIGCIELTNKLGGSPSFSGLYVAGGLIVNMYKDGNILKMNIPDSPSQEAYNAMNYGEVFVDGNGFVKMKNVR